MFFYPCLATRPPKGRINRREPVKRPLRRSRTGCFLSRQTRHFGRSLVVACSLREVASKPPSLEASRPTLVNYASDITPKTPPSANPPTSDRPALAHCLHALVSLLFHVSAMLSRNNAHGEAHRHFSFCLSSVKSCRLSHLRFIPVGQTDSTDSIESSLLHV